MQAEQEQVLTLSHPNFIFFQRHVWNSFGEFLHFSCLVLSFIYKFPLIDQRFTMCMGFALFYAA